jgi:hypothetical protein
MKKHPDSRVKSVAPSLPIVEATPVVPVDLPKIPKDNPWKKFKYGRSLYQRLNLPKN